MEFKNGSHHYCDMLDLAAELKALDTELDWTDEVLSSIFRGMVEALAKQETYQLKPHYLTEPIRVACYGAQKELFQAKLQWVHGELLARLSEWFTADHKLMFRVVGYSRGCLKLTFSHAYRTEPYRDANGTYDAFAQGVFEQSPNARVSWYLMASYGYYHEDASLFSDGFYDHLCKDLLRDYDSLQHPNLDLLNRCTLAAGSGYDIAERNYPLRVKVATLQLLGRT